MNYILLREYINKLSKNDIINYSNKYDIYLTETEVNILYNYIKNRYLDFIKNPDNIINELKFKLTNINFNKLLNLYNENKEKIRTYFP